MNDDKYYHEFVVYLFSDYKLEKKIAQQTEEMKRSGIKMLEEQVAWLKSRLPKDTPRKMGKVVKITGR